MKTHLLIIDPQVDFCDPNGALFVPEADKDIERLSSLIKRAESKDEIHVTLDMHHLIDIAHPIFWKDSNGRHPNPFTIISMDDIRNGKWTTNNPRFLPRATDYVKQLADGGRYPLCIWPVHCLIGHKGSNVHPELFAVLSEWEQNRFKMVDYVTKGTNLWTEHYSAVKAEVPDPEDPGTQLNIRLIETLQKADVIAISGQALSHCVANTIRDIADNFGEDNIQKFVLLEDTSSSVPGFEKAGEDFINEMVDRGMQVSTTTNFLK
jgi:nicotinamidase-related amidase